MGPGVLERQTAADRGGLQFARLAGANSSAARTRDILRAAAKRTMDVIGSMLGLVVLSPAFLLIALAIKLDSRGPVIFSQLRNGLEGERFLIYKFRSMTEPAAGGELAPGPHDERRITRLGRWLRASNLDELPQLWNVFAGSMSLVGPRPHPLALDAAYQPRLLGYAMRNDVKPGITGWAQVNGFRGTIRSEEAMRSRLDHDLAYIANRSLWLDCKILFLTVFSRKAYQNAR